MKTEIGETKHFIRIKGDDVKFYKMGDFIELRFLNSGKHLFFKVLEIMDNCLMVSVVTKGKPRQSYLKASNLLEFVD